MSLLKGFSRGFKARVYIEHPSSWKICSCCVRFFINEMTLGLYKYVYAYIYVNSSNSLIGVDPNS